MSKIISTFKCKDPQMKEKNLGSSLKVVGKYYISIFVFLNLDTNARFL